MKKIISILLAVMLVVSVAAVSVNAYNSDGDYSKLSPGTVYNPSDSYTVDANTPYSEDAVSANGGDMNETQTIYFQAPADWANEYNTFAGPDDSEPYMHVCAYWWSGTGSDWTDVGGGTVKWCGYQAHLVDKANRIYSITMVNDGSSPMVTWNNGVNGGMDPTKPIFNFARQIKDMNTEGCDEWTYDTLPEGTPNYDTDCDGCIAIMNPDESRATINALTGFLNYDFDLYVYYGSGCYGLYPTESENYHGRTASCVNPDHHHSKPGDVNNDKVVDVADVLAIQEHLAHINEITDTSMLDAADADGDGYVSIIDATRIQRYLAKMCNMDGSKPYKDEE